MGERAANLWDAVRRLAELPGCEIERLSPLYETEPVGPIHQGEFLNAVARLGTTLPPAELLVALQGIERAMGRAPAERWGPRLIDLDLLLYGDEHIATDDLTVPHPELWNRLFVLVPLLDVLPPGDLARLVQRRIKQLGGQQRVSPYRPR